MAGYIYPSKDFDGVIVTPKRVGVKIGGGSYLRNVLIYNESEDKVSLEFGVWDFKNASFMKPGAKIDRLHEELLYSESVLKESKSDEQYHSAVLENEYQKRFAWDYGRMFARDNNMIYVDFTKKSKCNRCEQDSYIYEIKKLAESHVVGCINKFEDFERRDKRPEYLRPIYRKLKERYIKMAKEGGLCHRCCLKLLDDYIEERNSLRSVLDLDVDNSKNDVSDEKPKRTPIPAKLRIELLNESARYVKELDKMIPSCAFCGAAANESKMHIDHILPVSKGGTNDKDNLQVLCATCNLQKNNRYELVINKDVEEETCDIEKMIKENSKIEDKHKEAVIDLLRELM